MNVDDGTTARPLLSDILVPVANEADARATAEALLPYSPTKITVLHVVEKGGGAPDKTPVEQSESIAEAAFAAFHETFPDAETEITYRADLVDGIIDVANEREASAIVFRPRGGSRIVQLLSGDRSLKLITDADRPVISLPSTEQ